MFNSPFFDYKYNQSLIEYEGRTKMYDSFVGCPERTEGPCPFGHPNITRLWSQSNTYVRINRGGVRWGSKETLRQLYDKGLDPDHVGGCLYRALVVPTEATIQRFLPHALGILNPQQRTIAIHQRTGDRVMHQLEKPPIDFKSDYWTCAARHAERIKNETHLPVRLFFVCDNFEYKKVRSSLVPYSAYHYEARTRRCVRLQSTSCFDD